MEPALALATTSAGLLATTLVIDFCAAGVGVLARMGSGSRQPMVARVGRLLTAVLVISVLLRIGQSGAVTPPPTQRIELSEPGSTEEPRQLSETSSAVTHGSATYVVEEGDCLWRIAKRRLEASGADATGADIGRLWRAIYAENRLVIGSDPDLILPGQILTIPGEPHGT